MANAKDHTNQELANLLEDHANDLIGGGIKEHDAEPLVRLAAERLRRTDESIPLWPRVTGELRRIATFSADLDMKRSLQRLLGGAST
jgi:hypothetical protein